MSLQFEISNKFLPILRTFWLRIWWCWNDNPDNFRRWGHRRRRVSVSLRQSARSTISAGQSPDYVDIANVENFTLRFLQKFIVNKFSTAFRVFTPQMKSSCTYGLLGTARSSRIMIFIRPKILIMLWQAFDFVAILGDG